MPKRHSHAPRRKRRPGAAEPHPSPHPPVRSTTQTHKCKVHRRG
jgi:hypothetical protein